MPCENSDSLSQRRNSVSRPPIPTSDEWKPKSIVLPALKRAYALSAKPELANLKKNGIPKHRYSSKLGQVRAHLEAAGDKQLQKNK